jgi:hypothetical protein
MLSVFDGPACEPLRDLEFSIGVDLVPELTWTGDYKAISVSVEVSRQPADGAMR